ncbi:cell adhesion molecule 1 isoform X1 [Pieris brassicae]|uniref:cell adhesion molecule 1 isoform X1 n=1 Tax=Pieris brassicae TaxID=7116 RepID=UPI001E661494|nr:cell adhesion molecule 1 isoform X1 [Pieris brassicae]
MLWSHLNLVCLALCCFHTTSEPHIGNHVRTRRSDERDGLALSREIFRNITKKLRQSIREGPTDNDHLLQGKAEESRQYAPYQELHHHERHWGPYFEEKNVTQVTAHVGAEALLNCRVVMLKDKTVMWLRHATETAQLLTVGPAPYAGDNRVASKYQYPNNWRLSINPVKWSDAGRYMCQISTHPPRTIYTDLSVLPPVLTINGDSTHDVKDKFYKAGSSIKLSCVISDEYVPTLSTKVPMFITTAKPTTIQATTELTTKMSTILNRLDLMLNKSWSVETTTLTSTVSLSTTTMKNEITTQAMQPVTRPVLNNIYGLVWRKQGKDIEKLITWRNMSATFSVSSASQNDSGLYSCHLLNHSQVIINVHVLSGENQAAVHHDTWNKGSLFWQPQILNLLTIPMLPFLFNLGN